MTITKEEIDFARDVERLVKKVKRVSPPPLQHLEGPGFVMIGRTYDPQLTPSKPRGFNHIELAQIAVIGALLTACIAVTLIYLTSPSIANL